MPQNRDLPPCPPGKIRNPTSRRCVKIDGKIGKMLSQPFNPVIDKTITMQVNKADETVKVVKNQNRKAAKATEAETIVVAVKGKVVKQQVKQKSNVITHNGFLNLPRDVLDKISENFSTLDAANMLKVNKYMNNIYGNTFLDLREKDLRLLDQLITFMFGKENFARPLDDAFQGLHYINSRSLTPTISPAKSFKPMRFYIRFVFETTTWKTKDRTFNMYLDNYEIDDDLRKAKKMLLVQTDFMLKGLKANEVKLLNDVHKHRLSVTTMDDIIPFILGYLSAVKPLWVKDGFQVQVGVDLFIPGFMDSSVSGSPSNYKWLDYETSCSISYKESKPNTCFEQVGFPQEFGRPAKQIQYLVEGTADVISKLLK